MAYELELSVNKTVSKRARVFCDLPFGMDEDDVDAVEHCYRADLGYCVELLIGDTKVREIAQDYRKPLPTMGNDDVWYADEQSIMEAYRVREGYYMATIYVPYSDEDYELEDENIEVEIY